MLGVELETDGSLQGRPGAYPAAGDHAAVAGRQIHLEQDVLRDGDQEQSLADGIVVHLSSGISWQRPAALRARADHRESSGLEVRSDDARLGEGQGAIGDPVEDEARPSVRIQRQPLGSPHDHAVAAHDGQRRRGVEVAGEVESLDTQLVLTQLQRHHCPPGRESIDGRGRDPLDAHGRDAVGIARRASHADRLGIREGRGEWEVDARSGRIVVDGEEDWGERHQPQGDGHGVRV